MKSREAWLRSESGQLRSTEMRDAVFNDLGPNNVIDLERTLPHLACLVSGGSGLGVDGVLEMTGMPAVRVRFGVTRNAMGPVSKKRIVATS